MQKLVRRARAACRRQDSRPAYDVYTIQAEGMGQTAWLAAAMSTRAYTQRQKIFVAIFDLLQIAVDGGVNRSIG